jgi:hypothetical protein
VTEPKRKDSKRSHPAPVVLSINLLGWLGPAVLVGLVLLALGLMMNANPMLPVLSSLFAVALLGYFGYRRRSQAHLTVDRHGLVAQWRHERIDIPWRSLQRIKGSTAWFDASTVLDQPGKTVPATVRRAVVRGKTPRVKLITFTRSLSTGEVGDIVRRYRPDLLVPPAEPSAAEPSAAA